MLWIWPVVAAVLLGVLGLVVRNTVENSVKTLMRGNLKTILETDVEALLMWLDDQKKHVSAVAADERVRKLTQELVILAAADNATPGVLLLSPQLKRMREIMQPYLAQGNFDGFGIATEDGRIIAAMRDDPVGKGNLPFQKGLMDGMFQGKVTVSRPQPAAILLEDASGTPRTGQPVMFAVGPIRDPSDDERIMAGIGLLIRPERDFSRILRVARAGESGETYAFDANGVLLSASRFDDNLKQIGLLIDNEDSKSILNIQIRDPGVNMVTGQRPTLRRSEQPLTRMAASAIKGESLVDVEGYNDYRGAPVLGAWIWLSDYGFGVATEVDVEEAYGPLYLLRYVFWSLFALLGIGSAAIFAFTVMVEKLNREARKAALEAKQLGQYSLDEKIGAGGMGVVYRGHHEMLSRPTAIKLLDFDKTTDQTIARFEREVQMTSQLNHPNTIAIYDYGRTPEGIFYYAMEYLEGIDLDELVKTYGPQCEGRVIHILQQLCGSLNEAHGVGLIHRDIKPGNIILTQRGGISDFVKLLDFGLVKALDGGKQAELTSADGLTGTPLFMSPEAIDRPDEVDAGTDLYAVGGVCYLLLTGTPVFQGNSVVEICMHQVSTPPQRPSERLGRSISEDLEAVVLRCLAKKKEDRFPNVEELNEALGKCQSAGMWTSRDAANWWKQHYGPGDETANVTPMPAETMFLNQDKSSG